MGVCFLAPILIFIHIFIIFALYLKRQKEKIIKSCNIVYFTQISHYIHLQKHIFVL